MQGVLRLRGDDMGEELGGETRWARGAKQMRPGPATRAALLSRTFLTAVFRQGERASRNCTGKGAMHRCSPETCASGLGFGVSILLGRRISEEAAKPGTGTLDMHRISPGDSLSGNHRQRRTLVNRFRTSHAFDCKHSAAGGKITQRQSAGVLCKNCGAEKLPVERQGKV